LPKPTTIAIDGPAASGKSTIGYELARRLDYLFFDTGVLYRAVTWAALHEGIAIGDEAAITALARRLEIDVLPPRKPDGRQYTVLVDGRDVTWEIRAGAVEDGVSVVSAYPDVRATLVTKQRRVSGQGRVVMVGRDIGTIVLPGAQLKLYLDARVKERARRRHRELLERGQTVGFDEVLAAMERRDAIDSEREVAPLQAAEDAVQVDTSDLSIQQVLDSVMQLVCAWAG
jgi:cytidylate kinase